MTRAVCKKLIEYVQSKNFDYVIHLHSFFELHTLEQVRYGDFNYYGDFNMTTFLEWLEPRTGQVVYDKEVGISTISRGAKVKYDMPSCRVNLTSLRQVSAPLLQYTISAFEQDLQSL